MLFIFHCIHRYTHRCNTFKHRDVYIDIHRCNTFKIVLVSRAEKSSNTKNTSCVIKSPYFNFVRYQVFFLFAAGDTCPCISLNVLKAFFFTNRKIAELSVSSEHCISTGHNRNNNMNCPEIQPPPTHTHTDNQIYNK